MSLKVAIIGCGKIADGHVEEIQKMPSRARVVAVSDLEGLMAEQLAVRYGVAAHYDDTQKMLERERPDVVHITTPPSSHLPLVRMALSAGCHVYAEKPLAPTLEDSLAIVDACEKANKLLTVGWTYLFDPPALEMRRMMAEGELGEPVHVESCYGYNLAGPFGSAIMGDGNHWVHRLPGKLLQNNIDHLLNKLVEFIDDEDPEIVARGFVRRANRYGDARDAMVDEMRLMVMGERVTASGLFSASAKPTGHFARVYGEKNTMHVDYVSRTVTLEATSSLPSAIGRLVPAFTSAAQYAVEGVRNVTRFAKSDFHFFAGLHELIARYYDAIIDDRPLPIPYRDIRRVTRWMDAIYNQVPQQGDAE